MKDFFSTFSLYDRHQGIITDGYYKGSSIYYFTELEGKFFYLIIRNNELNSNIIKMKIDNLNPDIIRTTHIIQDVELEYIRK